MRKKLTNNIGLKILSLFVSFAVWLLVVNIDDPVISTTYSGIQVDFIHEEALTEQNKTYEIVDNSDIISVTVTGKRSAVESIGKENIKAVADLSNISYTGNVDIALTTNKNNDKLDSLKADVSSVSLNIENLKTVHLPINVLVSGEPSDGYIVGDVSTNQNTVKVAGPESIISSIAKAESEVSVGSRTSDITTTADIKLYDSKGEIVESSYISMNIKTINIGVGILPTKSVPIDYNYSGNPKPGYMVSKELSSNYKSVYIAGKQSAIDQISSIVIPASVIDVEGLESQYKTTIDISKYLPNDVRFADPEFKGVVSVTVDIEQTVEKTFAIPQDNITISNVPSGYEAKIELDDSKKEDDDNNKTKATVDVNTVGIKDAQDAINANDITATIDVEEYMNSIGAEQLSEGVYKMELNVSLPDMVLPAGVNYVDVRIERQ